MLAHPDTLDVVEPHRRQRPLDGFALRIEQPRLWGTAEAQVLDRNGVVVTRWSLPPLTIAKQDRVALATAQGVLLFNNDWTFEVREDVG